MSRLLELIVFALLAWFWLERLARYFGAGIRAGRPSRPAAGPPPPAKAAGSLVRCVACGVHVPQARSVAGAGGEPFCSEACRRLAAPVSACQRVS
jgi:hypothetical protein